MSAAAPGEAFYRDLPAQRGFAALARDEGFAPVPADWHLVLTDVRDSTRAIAEGRYKDVNTLGAASIAAARRVLGALAFPFAFGGDGATLLVPGTRVAAVLAALAGLRELARTRFALDLRVGSLCVGELLAAGAPIEVARHALTEHCVVAALRGPGLRVAEQRLKAAPDAAGARTPAAAAPHDRPAAGASPSAAPSAAPGTAESPSEPAPAPDLSGLSCRWRPFATRRGSVLALIVEARSDGGADPAVTFPRVLRALEQLFPDGIDRANPAEAGLSSYRSLRENLRSERRLQPRALSFTFLGRLVETLLATLLFNSRLPLPTLRRYVRDTPQHCDFRKLDHSLRAVLDCTPAQAAAIEALLRTEHAAGTLHYGLHASDEALMTCLVEGLAPGQHLHFIDASGGGYALAAVHLKAQKNARTDPQAPAAP
ncbi:MAG: DUF3095 family protein [Planctomycetia bacterium]